MPARKILVDTNCFLRVYQSPILPILQHEVGGYLLLTLKSLIEEFLNNNRLIEQYEWVSNGEYIEELNSAVLVVRAAQKTAIANKIRELRPFSKSFLQNHYKKINVNPPKELSSRDLELLATAVVFGCDIATDEEPLGLVVAELQQDEIEVNVHTSLDIIYLFESNAKLTAEQRKQTVSNWIRKSEKLNKGWRSSYTTIFGESVFDIDT